LAYWCFTYIAILGIAIALLSVLPLEFATYQAIGMLSIPLVLLGFVAGVTGVVTTLARHRKEWPLQAMSAGFVGFCLLFVLSESLSADQYLQYGGWIKAAMSLFLLIIVLLSGRWFFSTHGPKKKPCEK